MRKVMTVAMMLLVSLSLIVSCPKPKDTNFSARVTLYDSAAERKDIEVNRVERFKVVIELIGNTFNTANVKKGSDVTSWFVLNHLGEGESSPEFKAIVTSLEQRTPGGKDINKEYDKVVAELSLKTLISTSNGEISVKIPKTGYDKNSWTKSNIELKADGTIHILSSYKNKVSVSVEPKELVVKPDAKDVSVVVTLKDGTFTALKKGDRSSLLDALKITRGKVIDDTFNIDIKAINGRVEAFKVVLEKKSIENIPKIARSSIKISISKDAITPNGAIEKPTSDLECVFSFECNEGGTLTPEQDRLNLVSPNESLLK